MKSRISLTLSIAFEKKIFIRAILIAIIVGLILNIINQGEILLAFKFNDVNYGKLLLTFLIPYLVSSVSSVLSMFFFKSGDISSVNGEIQCSSCNKTTVKISKGELVPFCPECKDKTTWNLLQKTDPTYSELMNKAYSMALFAEINPTPVLRFNLNKTILESNPAANSIFSKHTIKDLNIEDLLPCLKDININEIISKGERTDFIESINNKSFHFELIGIADLGICQIYGSDITEVIVAKSKFSKYKTAMKQTSNSIMITDKNGLIEFVNPAFEKISGYKKDEIIGKNPKILKTDYLSKEVYENLWKDISSGKVWEGEFYNQKKDGSKYWEKGTISPIINEKKEIINYILGEIF